MVETFTVKVVPQVLSWLRTSLGLEIEEVAKRLGTTAELIMKLESGNRSPTLRKMDILSEIYKIAVASFFLSNQKNEIPMLEDCKFLPKNTSKFNHKTTLAIRRTRSLQNLSKELSLDISHTNRVEIKSAKLTDNPELIALEYREMLNLDIEKRRKFRNAYKMLRNM